MCVFCDIAEHRKDARIIYESDRVISFLDNDPISTGHVLIIPKAHLTNIDELSPDTLTEIMELSQRIVAAHRRIFKPDGYAIMHNGGKFADFGHFHLHVFPRYDGDGFAWTSSDQTFDYSEEIANKIRTNLINKKSEL